MRRVWQGRAIWAMAALLPLALTGCNGFFVPKTGSSGTSTSGDYVYVANANPSVASIGAFAVGTGTLTAISGAPYALSFIPTALAVTPSNGYLYVGGSTGLYAYTIGTGGALTLVGNAGASIPVASIAISPDGNYLFALQSNVIVNTSVSPTAYSVTIDEYQVNSGGSLSLIGNPAFTTTTGSFTPKSIRVSPNQDFVAASVGSAGTIVFTLSSGTLSTTVNILAESNLSSDNDLAFDSTSSHLYIARSGTSNGLGAYTVSSSGALAQIGTTLAAAGTTPTSLVLDPTGKFAYIANYGSNSVTGYSIVSGALPTVLSTSPYTTGTSPIALATDNSKDYLLVLNSGGSPDLSLDTFNTSATGAISTTTSVSTGTDPTLPIAIAATH